MEWRGVCTDKCMVCRSVLLAAAIGMVALACRDRNGNGIVPERSVEARTDGLSSRPQPEKISVANDLPVYALGAKRGGVTMVFFHGMCTKPLDYLPSFQAAASSRGGLLALQGEKECPEGEGQRSFVMKFDDTDARIERGFSAAGMEDGKAIVAIGYSQGVTVAAGLAAKYPEKYRRLILMAGPEVVNAPVLTRLEGAVTMAGTKDPYATEKMNESAAALTRVGVPAVFMEIPNGIHGDLPEGDRMLTDALDWLDRNARK